MTLDALENPAGVLRHLAAAQAALTYAHLAAGETEGSRTDLIGPVRDIIFGLNSAVSGLVDLIEESRPRA
jgi:hypothetical protein